MSTTGMTSWQVNAFWRWTSQQCEVRRSSPDKSHLTAIPGSCLAAPNTFPHLQTASSTWSAALPCTRLHCKQIRPLHLNAVCQRAGAPLRVRILRHATIVFSVAGQDAQYVVVLSLRIFNVLTVIGQIVLREKDSSFHLMHNFTSVCVL